MGNYNKPATNNTKKPSNASAQFQLVPNAETKATELLRQDNTIAIKKSLDVYITKNYKTKFVQDMQVYITKIGLVLNSCISSGPKMGAHTYLGSIDFICNKLLKNTFLHKVLKEGLGINDGGNTVKHNIKDIDVDFDLTLKNYNLLISEIIKKTGLHAFKICYLNKTKSERDVPVIDEERHHKYFMADGVKFQLKLNERYEVDPYAKTVSTKITLYWPDGARGKYASVYVKCNKDNRILCSREHIDISKSNSKEAIHFKCNENELDRRVLYATVIVKVEKKIQQYCGTTGILFWKEDHYKDAFEVRSTHEEKISQFFKPKH